MEVDDAFGLQTKQKIEEIANAKWHLLFQCLILHHTSSELISYTSMLSFANQVKWRKVDSSSVLLQLLLLSSITVS